MKTVNVTQLRRQFSTLLRRANRGEAFLITVRGKAVAILTPPKKADAIIAARGWDPYEAGRKLTRYFAKAKGGSISRADAATRLGLPLKSVNQLIRSKRVVVWTDATGRFHLPVWQFGPKGVLEGIPECLTHLGSDNWGHMRFFLTPAESANGRTPLELLRKNMIAEALAIAKITSAW